MLKWVSVYKCLTKLFIYTSPGDLNRFDLTCILSKYNIIKMKSWHYKIYKYISWRGLYKIISPRISFEAAISLTPITQTLDINLLSLLLHPPKKVMLMKRNKHNCFTTTSNSWEANTKIGGKWKKFISLFLDHLNKLEKM